MPRYRDPISAMYYEEYLGQATPSPDQSSPAPPKPPQTPLASNAMPSIATPPFVPSPMPQQPSAMPPMAPQQPGGDFMGVLAGLLASQGKYGGYRGQAYNKARTDKKVEDRQRQQDIFTEDQRKRDNEARARQLTNMERQANTQEMEAKARIEERRQSLASTVAKMAVENGVSPESTAKGLGIQLTPDMMAGIKDMMKELKAQQVPVQTSGANAGEQGFPSMMQPGLDPTRTKNIPRVAMAENQKAADTMSNTIVDNARIQRQLEETARHNRIMEAAQAGGTAEGKLYVNAPNGSFIIDKAHNKVLKQVADGSFQPTTEVPKNTSMTIQNNIADRQEDRQLHDLDRLERQQIVGFKKAAPVLDSIWELSEKINVNQGVLAKAVGAVEKQKAKVNLDDDVAEYQALVEGFTPLLARAVGHVGVLTQQDVDSVKAMLPAPGDSKSVRDRKVARIKKIMAGAESGVRDVFGSEGGAAPVEWERGPDGKPRKKVIPQVTQ